MSRKKVLIKYGGNAMLNKNLKAKISKQLKDLHSRKCDIILVHGGGPFINRALKIAGIESAFFDGQRHTSAEALVQIEKTLKGEVNSSLVSMLNDQGLKAVGLSGKDGKMALAVKRWHSRMGEEMRIDLGQVGDIKSIDTKLIHLLVKNGYTPVITCIASDEQGLDYNINADMFAGHLAAAMKVDEYILLTDVDGLFANYPDPTTIFRSLKLDEIAGLYGNVIQGGMIPKIESCEIALNNGAGKAVILNGTKPAQIESYLIDKQSIGTTILK